jgi:hypothetical protein
MGTMINNGVGGRNNAGLIVLASTEIKADTVLTYDYENFGGSGIQVILDVSVKTSTPTSLTLLISGIDPASLKAHTLLAGAAVTGTGTVVYRVFPGSTVTTNLAANDFLPRQFRITLTPSGCTGSAYFTASIGMNILR